MRKTITMAAAAALVVAAALMSGSTQAMPFGAPAGVHGAAETLNPIEKAACWRYGWRGWGWYPCGWVGPRRWGWHRGWGWRRWHRW
jgi:hypothetical protein